MTGAELIRGVSPALEEIEPSAECSADELAALANASHRMARQYAAAAVEHALRAGRALAFAKQQVAHGEWAEWLAVHFEGSARTARRWMQAAAAAENGPAANLEPASVRALLAGASENRDAAEQRGGGQRATRDPVERLLAAVYDAALHFCYDRGGGDEFAVRLGEAVVTEGRRNWAEEWPSIRAALARTLEAERREGGGP